MELVALLAKQKNCTYIYDSSQNLTGISRS